MLRIPTTQGQVTLRDLDNYGDPRPYPTRADPTAWEYCLRMAYHMQPGDDRRGVAACAQIARRAGHRLDSAERLARILYYIHNARQDSQRAVAFNNVVTAWLPITRAMDRPETAPSTMPSTSTATTSNSPSASPTPPAGPPTWNSASSNTTSRNATACSNNPAPIFSGCRPRIRLTFHRPHSAAITPASSAAPAPTAGSPPWPSPAPPPPAPPLPPPYPPASRKPTAAAADPAAPVSPTAAPS